MRCRAKITKLKLELGFYKLHDKLAADAVAGEKKVEEELSDIYHSPEVFRLNYAEMERKFKVYIYPDGDPNTFYQTPRKLTGKYASEGLMRCRGQLNELNDAVFKTTENDKTDGWKTQNFENHCTSTTLYILCLLMPSKPKEDIYL